MRWPVAALGAVPTRSASPFRTCSRKCSGARLALPCACQCAAFRKLPGPLRRPARWPTCQSVSATAGAVALQGVGARPPLRFGHAPPRPPPAHSARRPQGRAQPRPCEGVAVTGWGGCRRVVASVIGVTGAGPWAGWSWRQSVPRAPPQNRGRCPHPPLSRGARGRGVKGQPPPPLGVKRMSPKTTKLARSSCPPPKLTHPSSSAGDRVPGSGVRSVSRSSHCGNRERCDQG